METPALLIFTTLFYNLLVGVQSQLDGELFCPIKARLLYPEDGQLTISCVDNDSKSGTCSFRNMGSPINTDVVELVSLDGSAEVCSDQDTGGNEDGKEKCLYLGAGTAGSVTWTCADPNGCQYICCAKDDPASSFDCSESGPAAAASTTAAAEADVDGANTSTSGSLHVLPTSAGFFSVALGSILLFLG